MNPSDRDARERLVACLAKLARIKPGDLVREEALGRELSFRAGLPYFTRTLELYQRITPRDYAKAPGEYLKIVADHAEDALHRFEEILSFDPQGMQNAGELRSSLIDEVRDSYTPAYEDVAVIIRPVRGQPEKIARQWSGQMVIAGLIILVIGAAIVAHHYMLYELLGDMRESLEKIMHGR